LPSYLHLRSQVPVLNVLLSFFLQLRLERSYTLVS
jgi:hypothetical protein